MKFLHIGMLGFLLQFAAMAHEIELVEDWTDHFLRAKEEAQKRHCALLIAFLGPNWCEHSDQLENEILSQKEFKDQLGEQFVFVRVDIPEDFDQKTYFGKTLKEKYGVEECPTIVIITENGKLIAKLDNLPITCQQLIAQVKQLQSDYQRFVVLNQKELRNMKVDEIQHLYARAGHLADATFKQALMKQGLKIDRGPYFLVEKYGNLLASGLASERQLIRLRNRVIARDPQNERGCLRKLALIEFESRSEGKLPGEVIEPLIQYLKAFGCRDSEHAWQLEMKISQYLFSCDQIHEALKHARLSFDSAPEEAQKEIAHSIEYLQSLIQ